VSGNSQALPYKLLPLQAIVILRPVDFEVFPSRNGIGIAYFVCIPQQNGFN